MLRRPDHPRLAVEVERCPAPILAEGRLRRHAARRRHEEFPHHRVVGPRDIPFVQRIAQRRAVRSEEHTSELQSLMRISYAVFCLKKKTIKKDEYNRIQIQTHNTQ